MISPLMSFLGIVKKSGKLIFGMESVKKYCLKGEVKLVLVTYDISKNSLDKIASFLKNLSIKCVIINHDKYDIESVLNKHVAIMGVLDDNMTNKIMSLDSENFYSERIDVYNDKI